MGLPCADERCVVCEMYLAPLRMLDLEFCNDGSRIHDTIFCVAKSQDFRFTPLKVAGDKLKIPHTLITGSDGRKYQTYELTGAGTTAHGKSGQPWKGYDPSAMGRHWANSHATMG